ncbi:hypothetical protein BD410DRAFT_793852 [Rickenella mellea]|uniref:F-box domain-containing protein n=1 Tax=Rickenella mellea TaxID=50990 RepID=A0A4Y7PTG2_9AGAM|nr:hypothetical protein BD410DRAFT_793852 [Rickenella mellea]
MSGSAESSCTHNIQTPKMYGDLQSVTVVDQHIIWLKMQRNSLLPVNRLPPDILFTILDFLANSETTMLVPKPLVVATQVCKHWRDVGLNYSSLWSRISIGDKPSGDLFRLTVERSRSAPLSVKINSSRHQDVINVILLESNRIRDLNIVLGRDETKKLLASHAKRLPVLESLQLEQYLDVVSLPDIFTRERHPRLKSLVLHGYTVPWNSPVLQELSFLQLSTGVSSQLPLLKVAELLQIFKACPGLMEFTFDYNNICSTDESGTSLPPHSSINLPRLRKFILGYVSDLTCATLLERLVLPTNVSFALNIEKPRFVFPLRSDWVANFAELGISISSNTLEIHSGDKRDTLGCIDFRWFIVNTISLSNLVQVTQPFQMSRIKVLDLYMSPDKMDSHYDSDLWTNLFSHFPEISAFYFSGQRRGNLHYLQFPMLQALSSTPPPCPSLTLLSLESLKFNALDKRQLEECITVRSNEGIALTEVKITGCSGIDQTVIASFSPMVGTVNWDEIQDWRR